MCVRRCPPFVLGRPHLTRSSSLLSLIVFLPLQERTNELLDDVSLLFLAAANQSWQPTSTQPQPSSSSSEVAIQAATTAAALLPLFDRRLNRPAPVHTVRAGPCGRQKGRLRGFTSSSAPWRPCRNPTAPRRTHASLPAAAQHGRNARRAAASAPRLRPCAGPPCRLCSASGRGHSVAT